MQIQSTTIKAYTFTLTETEIQNVIDNPAIITGRFRAALNGAFDEGATSVTEEPKRKKGKGITLGRRPKGERKPFTKTRCPICNRELSEARLALHLRTKHPNQS